MRRPRLRSAVFLLLALAMPRPVPAVDPSLLKGYRLGVMDGLANNSVYCIEQDRRGFVWMGTFGGLSRYDGESFLTFRPSSDPSNSIAASVVFDLHEDARGYLWVATDGGGLSRFDQASGIFVTWRASGQEGTERISSDRVLTLAEDPGGTIWAGTDRGSIDLVEISGAVRRIGPDSTLLGGFAVRAIVGSPDGMMWAGSEGGGLSALDASGSVVRRYRHIEGEASSLASDVVRSLHADDRGRLWIGLGDGGIDVLDIATGTLRHALDSRDGPGEAVRAIARDADGGIWAGFADSGIGYLDPESGRFSAARNGGGAVRAIMRDQSGLMWVGYKEGGVEVLNPRSALVSRHERMSGGSPLFQMRGLAEGPDGLMYLASDGLGLLYLNPATGRIAPHPGYPRDRGAAKAYTLLSEADGTLWVGTDGGGLLRVRGHDVRRYRHSPSRTASIASDVIWALHRDPDGTLWVGTEGGGLDRYDYETDAFVHYPSGGGPDAIRGASVRAIFRDSRRRLWVGTWDGGLSAMDPATGLFAHFYPSTDPSSGSSSGLQDSSVNCVTEDAEGAIWIGTGGSGIARFDEAAGRFMHYGEREGLSGATVYGLLTDSKGDLWISTATGLTRRDRTTGRFLTFGASDGLVSDGMAQNSFLKDSAGRLWFGGRSGLSSFDPLTLKFDDPPPEVAISTIGVPDSTAASSTADRMPLLAASHLDLPFANAGIRFSLAVLDYRSPGRHRYRILLEGSGEEWTDLAKGNSGYLARLGPGRHLLRVRGANGNGIWSHDDQGLVLEVRQPFWGTWLFRAGIAPVMGAMVFLVVRMRTASLKRRNELLQKLSHHVEAAREEERIAAARDVHDEIGQHLAAINLQAWWLDLHPRAPAVERRERIEEMKGSVAEAMAAVKRIATNLRPVALDALTFPEALRWYLHSFERRSGIKATLSLSGVMPAIADNVATALFRISQELLTNVIRHARAHAVSVSLTVSPEEDRIVFVVKDDGRGIDPGKTEAEDSFGLIGIRERCAAYGGLFSISGAPDRGTIAQVVFPLSSIRREASS